MMTPLITRLEEAAEGSRALDTQIANHFDTPDTPLVTTSFDAAYALAERVLPGWSFLMAITPERTLCSPSTAPLGNHQAVWTEQAAAATPALALCIAVLKAKHIRD